MNSADQIAEALRPFLGSEFDAKAERKARKALKEAGFEGGEFFAEARHRDPPKPRNRDTESLEDYQARIAEWESQPHPGIASLTIDQLSVTVKEAD